MAEVIDTASIDGKSVKLRGSEQQGWIYNGFDTLGTHEIHGKISPLLRDADTRGTYAFELACCGPAMSMMLTGMLVDKDELAYQVYRLEAEWNKVDKWLQRLVVEVTGDGVNYRSPSQLKELFYETMGLPVQYQKTKGEKRVSTGREALEKLKLHFYAVPIIKAILKLRDIDKQVMVLKSGLDHDGRMRFSFNVAATETGRWSSSKNCFGRGTNGQNITEEMRKIFIADPGRKIAYPDGEQAESRAVAYLSADANYIKACESGDLHTTVASMVWPDLDWTGDPAHDRLIADQPCYRHFSFRDLSKRGGHASNYLATAWTIARSLKIEQKVAEEFQDRYFSAFVGIRRWHHKVQMDLQSDGYLITPLGRKRTFFGRPRDDATLREAIAYEPQSLVVDIINQGLLYIWEEFEIKEIDRIQVLLQQHDGVVFQYWEEDREVVDLVIDRMTIPVPILKQSMTIPIGMKVGYRWYAPEMVKWGSPLERKQVRPVSPDLLDLPLG